MESHLKKTEAQDAVGHRPGITNEEMADFYTQWAATYDKDLDKDVYTGVFIVADAMKKVYPDNRDKVRILDVACGTGLLGEQLHSCGFCQMDGLDASPGMLARCQEKSLYGTLYKEFINEKPITSIPAGTYDAVVIAGGLGEGHIQCNAFTEMVRLVKPGGHVCFVMRLEYTEYASGYKDGQFDAALRALETAGRWQKVIREIVPNYSFNKPGLLCVFRVQ